ncbi:MAG: M23 family metallopeptidase [Candidatus Peribacteraceae bacterium]|jgi:murein DD-endopeptidase MepM/ murein hydrolase activator NlpD|nr:M23 family metallopeptidase [Candidatus Peribacteraceae bacterium]
MRLRFALFGMCLLLAACGSAPAIPAPQHSSAGSKAPEVVKQNTWIAPLDHANERVTKKPFGIFITPQNSPVQPEKFTGYHTGTDFELLPGETEHDVIVRAACAGAVIFKNQVSGYGGVVVQHCTVNDQPVTALYGHLSLSSVAAGIKQLQTGDRIGVLGTGFSDETDNERAHLHFAIHRGAAVELKGYVQTKEELDGWVDAGTVLGLPL